jgi:hypothetical protein
MLEAIIVGAINMKNMCFIQYMLNYNIVVSNPRPGGGGGGSFMSCLYIRNK